MRSESDRAATTSQSDQLLREMTEVIVREVHPAQIILFGSRARGEAGPEADVDLLIVREEPFILAESRRQQLTRLYELWPDLACPRIYCCAPARPWRNGEAALTMSLDEPSAKGGSYMIELEHAYTILVSWRVSHGPVLVRGPAR